MKAIVTSKGQVTIPLMIRTKANITPGTKLDFEVEEDGSIRVNLLNQDITALKGMIKPKNKKPVTVQEMKKAIHENSKKAMQ